MSTFRNILPSFLTNSDSSKNVQNSPRITHRSRSSTTTLHRKADSLASSLVAAESHLSTLRTKVHTILSAYEQHYHFLRRAAHVSANSNAVLERNGALLATREEELTEIIEDLNLALQVAGLKAKAQREEIDGLVDEVKRWRELASENREYNQALTFGRILICFSKNKMKLNEINSCTGPLRFSNML